MDDITEREIDGFHLRLTSKAKFSNLCHILKMLAQLLRKFSLKSTLIDFYSWRSMNTSDINNSYVKLIKCYFYKYYNVDVYKCSRHNLWVEINSALSLPLANVQYEETRCLT